MIKLKFMFLGEGYPFHHIQHAAVSITNTKTGEATLVNFHGNNWKKTGPALYTPGKTIEKLQSTCKDSIVTLYCHDKTKSIAEFRKLYNDKFRGSKFNFVTNNCTDAVNLALEYFIPEAFADRKASCAYDTICCFLMLITFGLKCFAPSFISLPFKTYQEVKGLEKKFGVAPEELVHAEDRGSCHPERSEGSFHKG